MRKASVHLCEKERTNHGKAPRDHTERLERRKAFTHVLQVGVQSTSLNVWDQARELINAGKLGKVLGYQTEYFRNSSTSQWRYYELKKDMTPKNILQVTVPCGGCSAGWATAVLRRSWRRGR